MTKKVWVSFTMYDFIMRLKTDENQKAIGFVVFLDGNQIAEMLFFPGGWAVANACMLHHNGEKIFCKDRIEALAILRERMDYAER